MECKNCLRVNQLAFQREESLKKRLQLMGEKIKELNGGNQQKRLSHLMDVAGRLRLAVDEMLFAYQNKDGDWPHGFETKAIEIAKKSIAEWDGIKKEVENDPA